VVCKGNNILAESGGLAHDSGNARESYFLSVIRFARSKRLIGVMQAFFDESGRAGGVFCVAGYVFAAPQARKFIRDWRRLFGERVFHMVDVTAGRGEFKDVTRSERDVMLRKAVQIINSRVTFGVAVSCNVDEVLLHSPRWLRGFGHAYPVCCHLCMTTVGNMLRDRGIRERAIYTFEKGHEFEAEARDFVKMTTANPEVAESYLWGGDAFLPKADAVPLQAADLFAWEWAKCRDETFEQQLRPMRNSLRALFESDPKRYSVSHITGQPLITFMNQIRALGLEQLAEQRDEGAERIQ
jgi:hypothetical protein